MFVVQPVVPANAAENLLSYNKPTTTSSIEDASFAGNYAVDGDAATRWASAEGSDPQWISVDLGGPAAITKVKLLWEAAYASEYKVQTSSDGTSWSDVKSVTGSDGTVDEVAGLSASGQYVRIYGTKRATPYGYSLFELEVYGTRSGGGDVDPPTAPAGLRVTSSTADSVSLAWDPASDNVGVTGYEILRNGNVVATSATTSFADTGLASGTGFTYTVRARDAAGNLSAASAPVQGATQPGGSNGTVLVVAGDIAKPELPGEHTKTAKLIEGIKPSYVLTVGDNQYDNGTLSEYQSYYDKTWGKFKNITRPTPGNHEWYDQLKGYKAYFGSIATPQGKPYYSYDVGDFHFVALDSDPLTDGGSDAAQLAWLRDDLARNQKACVVGYWHHPRFNSGKYGDDKSTAPFWTELLKVRADLVFGGHDHHYERIKPLNASGKVDEANGIRTAIVGIGGDSLYTQIKPRVGVEKSFAKHGVMKLVLNGKSYSWEIIGTDGKVLDKAGPYTCR
ncbi:discoidin domain-containing protein [Kibdelosporangium philippinense]|uniref:Discoidin domain-containing protein n=1 Tax=Kibdelosporangium philippinense TaxID=211113 RepID=A0ABS8ZF41_9PSEU|nr:discoidin domain-containing protein [Kibdelosporangium philippinense]MCE7004467.1 discoidin domain-containing protein [Kibdelosporangium philippinense]